MEDQRVLKEKSSGIKCSWNLIKMKIKLTRTFWILTEYSDKGRVYISKCRERERERERRS
jgi:hypothetical protein